MSAGVVVGYDGSDCAKAALRVAVGVGRAYGEPVTIAFGYDVSPSVARTTITLRRSASWEPGACRRHKHWSETTPGRSMR